MPNFSISVNSVLSVISGGSLLGFVSSIISPSYGIFYADGDDANDKALDFHSAISFDYSGDAVVTNAPVASSDGIAGSYSSINKVVNPAKITMRVSVEGMTGFSGAIPRLPSLSNLSLSLTSRTDIINKLEEMKGQARLYNIETPDKVYEKFDLIDYKFVMTAQSGVTLLLVDIIFQEVKTLDDVEESNGVGRAKTSEAKTPSRSVI